MLYPHKTRRHPACSEKKRHRTRFREHNKAQNNQPPTHQVQCHPLTSSSSLEASCDVIPAPGKPGKTRESESFRFGISLSRLMALTVCEWLCYAARAAAKDSDSALLVLVNVLCLCECGRAKLVVLISFPSLMWLGLTGWVAEAALTSLPINEGLWESYVKGSDKDPWEKGKGWVVVVVVGVWHGQRQVIAWIDC